MEWFRSVNRPLWVGISALVGVISHEAGHTFGESHSLDPAADPRQPMGIFIGDPHLDFRFSHVVVNHDTPESGVMYAEYDRLKVNLGLAQPNATAKR